MLPFSYKNIILACSRITRNKEERKFLTRLSCVIDDSEISYMVDVSMLPAFIYKGFTVEYVVLNNSLYDSVVRPNHLREIMNIGYALKCGGGVVQKRFKWKQINRYISHRYIPYSGLNEARIDWVVSQDVI